MIGIVVATLLLAIGAYTGLHSPKGTKHAQTKHGIAMRANEETDLVMFDADDGTQVDVGADRIWWESASASGDGNPPCLRRPHEKADVEVGVMRIARPGGGWFQQAVWVRCL